MIKQELGQMKKESERERERERETECAWLLMGRTEGEMREREREGDRMRQEGVQMKRRRDNAGRVCRQVILLPQLPCV